jgi:hypothetical protein
MVDTEHFTRLLMRLQLGAATACRDADADPSAAWAAFPPVISRVASPRVGRDAASSPVARSSPTLFQNSVPGNADAQPVAHPGVCLLARSSSGGSSVVIRPAHEGRGVAG